MTEQYLQWSSLRGQILYCCDDCDVYDGLSTTPTIEEIVEIHAKHLNDMHQKHATM